MPARDIIVVGASAGGLEALRTLVSGLPKNLNASVFIVLHIGPDSPGLLDRILSSDSEIIVKTPKDRERIMPGRVYVAPADNHLIIEPGVICISHGPKENRFRPAIDPLFRSAAQVYGPRVVGIVLTGGLDDGTAGLWAVKQLGGTAVVQDPNDALYPSMPMSALQYVDVDHCVTIKEIAPLIVKLSQMEPEEKGRRVVPKHLDIEVKIAKQDPAIDLDVRELWEKSSYTCPECHGVLMQLKEGNRERFRCHTGHAFSADSLLANITEGVEESLWTTIRNIEESVLLMRHMAKHMMEQDPRAANEFLQKADEAKQRSELVRKAVFATEELTVERIEERTEP